MSDARTANGFRQTFRHRSFAIYSAAQWVSNIGMWVSRVGIGWFAWDLTHSGAWLGAVAAAQALPSVFLTPFAGALADRMDQVKLMRITQAASGLLAAAIAAATFAGIVTPIVLLAYSLAHGVFFAMGMPARITIGPNLVPREDVAAAIAVSSVIFGSSMFIGPAVSGLLIEHAGIAWTFTANACAFGSMYLALHSIKLARVENTRPRGETSLIADTVEGIKFVAGHRGILSIMLVAFLMSLAIRPLLDLMPGFADEIFHRPTEGLATLMSAFGIGAMAGSAWMANRNRLGGTTTITIAGVALSAALNIVFAAVPIYPVGIAVAGVMGFTAAMGFNGAQTLVQNAAAGPMRARVMGLYAYNFQGVPALGAMLMGAASHVFGLQWPVIVGGALCLAATGFAWLCRRDVAKDMESIDGGAASSPPSRAPAP
jgi:MFS family permease